MLPNAFCTARQSTPSRTPLAVLLLLLSAVFCLGSDGTFVPAGQPRPKPDFLRVAGGMPAKLDLLMTAPLPVDNQCRTILYALGGPLAAQVSEQTGRLLIVADGRNGYRTSLNVAIPSARPGARFLLKTECLSPTSQLLGAVELRVPDFDSLAEVRASLIGRQVQIAGRSQKLRVLLNGWQIPFSDRLDPVPGVIVFTEEPADPPPQLATTPHILVEFVSSSGPTLILTGQKSGAGWKVEAQLPRSHDLSSPEAADHLDEIVRFIRKLETLN